jgi:hypothetical protein
MENVWRAYVFGGGPPWPYVFRTYRPSMYGKRGVPSKNRCSKVFTLCEDRDTRRGFFSTSSMASIFVQMWVDLRQLCREVNPILRMSLGKNLQLWDL